MISNSVLDAALNKIASATAIHITVADPADRDAAIANSMASYAPSFSAIAEATGGGRKITKQAGSDSAAEAGGTPGFRAYVDATELLYSEPVGAGSTDIAAGGEVNDGASTITIGDPTFS